jgi:uncharacterized membrane protein YtjA (UPF0391 family)
MLMTLSSLMAQTVTMPNLLWLAIVFFILSIVAYAFGARGVAGMSAGIGRTLMFVFLALFVIVLLLNYLPR